MMSSYTKKCKTVQLKSQQKLTQILKSIQLIRKTTGKEEQSNKNRQIENKW